MLNCGMENIKQHTFALTHYTYTVLSTFKHTNGAPLVHIYSDTDFSSPDSQGPIINFNVLDENGEIIGYSQVDKLAGLYNIHLRTGCFCNTGACQQYLEISNDDIKKNFQAGHECGDDVDLIDGHPTGSVRISFGYMSTFEDAQAFLKFILAIRQSGCNTVKFLSPGETVSELVASIRENDHLWDNNTANKLHPKNSQFSANSPVIMPANLQPARNHSARGMAYVSGNSTEALPSGSRPITVTNIYLYPIKSCAAFEVMQWPIGNQGLLYDRNWMVTNHNGVCITQKQEPRLCLVQPMIDLEQNVMLIKAEGMDPISVPLEENSGSLNKICQSKVCSHRVQTYDCGGKVADWFSEFLGRQCYLIRQNLDFKNNVNKKDEKEETSDKAASLSLVNEAQYLLINRTSILQLRDTITTRLGEPLLPQELIQRFRANIVISTNEPFEEDKWEEIKIGDLHFKVMGPCHRCLVICIDQQTGQRNKEFLQSLASTRDKKTNFGIYLMNDLERQCSLPTNLAIGSPAVVLSMAKNFITCSASTEEPKLD